MLQHPLFYAQLTVLIIVAVLHSVGVYASLYWLWPPFDLVTHFLGGMWVGLAAIWIFLFSGIAPDYFRRFSLLTITLVSVLFVGILWEVFEFSVGVSQEFFYYQDTALDIIMDMFGALAAWWFVKNRYDE